MAGGPSSRPEILKLPFLALNTAGELIQQRFKNVTLKFYNGNNSPAPEHIRKQCAEESDVDIGATAD